MVLKGFPQYRSAIGVAVFFVILSLLPQAALSGVVRQVRPHVVLPPPRPPVHVLQKKDFYKWASDDVMVAVRRNGLEAADVEKGLTVGAIAARESRIFLIPSYGEDVGGVAASYDSEERIAEALSFYVPLNTIPGAPAWRIFRRDNVLLLISGKVPREKALEYQKALQQMK